MVTQGEIRAGRAFIELFIDQRAALRDLQNLGATIGAAGRRLSDLGRSALAVGASIAAPFTLAVKQASDFQDTLSKFDVVFGDASERVGDFARDLAREIRRSESDIRRFLAGFQDLLVPIGVDRRQAEETSKILTRLAFDLASFSNVADEQAFEDLSAALTGSSEVMKKYGVVVNETAVKQELLNRRITPSQATEAQKVLARVAIILAGTSAAQGDVVRTSNDLNNQIKALTAAFKDLAIQAGQALVPVLEDIAAALLDIAPKIKDFVSANSQLAVKTAGFGASLTVLAPILVIVGKAISALSIAFQAMTSSLPALIASVAVFGLALANVATRGNVFADLFRNVQSSIKEIKSIFLSAIKTGDFADIGRSIGIAITEGLVEILDALTLGVFSSFADRVRTGIKAELSSIREIAEARAELARRQRELETEAQRRQEESQRQRARAFAEDEMLRARISEVLPGASERDVLSILARLPGVPGSEGRIQSLDQLLRRHPVAGPAIERAEREAASQQRIASALERAAQLSETLTREEQLAEAQRQVSEFRAIANELRSSIDAAVDREKVLGDIRLLESAARRLEMTSGLLPEIAVPEQIDPFQEMQQRITDLKEQLRTESERIQDTLAEARVLRQIGEEELARRLEDSVLQGVRGIPSVALFGGRLAEQVAGVGGRDAIDRQQLREEQKQNDQLRKIEQLLRERVLVFG